MERDIDKVLITSERIQRRVSELADEIARTYEGGVPGDLTLVTILSGSLIFLADLVRQLPMRLKISLMAVSSYGGGTVSQDPVVLSELDMDVAGRHVLIVDDILDSGSTLQAVREKLQRREPLSIRTCVLLHKPGKSPPDVKADFVGFEIEDSFVVGYGLDYNHLYRNYPHIGVLRKELYESRCER